MYAPQIKAKAILFTNKFLFLLQLRLFFFNPLPNSAKKGIIRNWEKRYNFTVNFGKFSILCKNSKIYNKIYILTDFWKYTSIFGYFIALLFFAYLLRKSLKLLKFGLPTFTLSAINQKIYLILDQSFFLDAQVNFAYFQRKIGFLLFLSHPCFWEQKHFFTYQFKNLR